MMYLLFLLQVLVTGTKLNLTGPDSEDVTVLEFPESSTAKSESPSTPPVLEFSQSSGSRRRMKREWVIPPIFFPENDRGPFPKTVVQIKTSLVKETKMIYSINGEGADVAPQGLFTINRKDGTLYVTRPLDREVKEQYLLQAFAFSADGLVKEAPIEFIVNVIDMNDNKPIFVQDPFLGSVHEASPIGFEFMTVSATDADEPNNDNSDVRYTILRQTPDQPNANMFSINPVSGAIRVNSESLDRENFPEYTLEIQAADLQGRGLVSLGRAVISVTNSNKNAPQFEKTLYTVSVPENKVGAVVVKMPVTDRDDPQTPAWNAKFRIVSGNNSAYFSVNTGPNKQEGIITTAMPLDFEQNNRYTLLVAAENDAPFVKPMPTSTATVIVNVQDVNEAPVFDPEEKIISKPENLAVDTELLVYTATDPDTTRNQKVTYRMGLDPAGWLSIDGETGLIKVKSRMDRESSFLKAGKYTALIHAIDNDQVPATGTGTLMIELTDVNDNAPYVEERSISLCSKDFSPVLLTVLDKDGPGHAAPYRVALQGGGNNIWIAKMNDKRTGIIFSSKTVLDQGEYDVVLRIYDKDLLHQDSPIHVSVRDCREYFCVII